MRAAVVDELGRILQDQDWTLTRRHTRRGRGEMTGKNAMVGHTRVVEEAIGSLRRRPVADRVPGRSLIAVVKLVAVGIAGQAHGSLRGRHFDRLIMALDRLSRPMWCSRLSGRTSTRIPGIGLDCAIVLTGRSRWYQLTWDIGVSHASSLGPCDDQRKGSPEIHIA